MFSVTQKAKNVFELKKDGTLMGEGQIKVDDGALNITLSPDISLDLADFLIRSMLASIRDTAGVKIKASGYDEIYSALGFKKEQGVWQTVSEKIDFKGNCSKR